jgi:hypothetical protein
MNSQLEIAAKNVRENINPALLQKLPYFLVIGAAKCGTTSLCDNLDFHPQLSLSAIKEPRFFCAGRYDRGVEWYTTLWNDKDLDKKKFEGSTLYCFTDCQKRIFSLIPDVKLIMMIRNPVNRAWSHYWPFFYHKGDPLSILTDPSHQIIQRGIYVEQIKKWHKYFPKENLLIIQSEDYFADEAGVLKKIHDFVGVEHIIPNIISKRDPWADMKKSTGYPLIPDEIRTWLTNFYRPHNDELAEYLGQRINW